MTRAGHLRQRCRQPAAARARSRRTSSSGPMSACAISSRATSSLRRRCCPRAVSPLARRGAPRRATDPHRDDAHVGLLDRRNPTPPSDPGFRGVIRVGERCESGVDGDGRCRGGVRPRPIPARVQARGPVRGRVGPDPDDAVAPRARSMPDLHDGHRDAHGRLPPRSPRDPRRVRRRRDRVPVVLGLRGGLARRGVQQVPGGGGVHARAGPRGGARGRSLPVPVRTRRVDPPGARPQGLPFPHRDPARVGRCSRTSSRST